MGRLIQWAVLVFLGVMLYRYVQKKIAPAAPSRPGRSTKTEKLVQCRQCGIRLPESEAFRKNDAYYCPRHRGRG